MFSRTSPSFARIDEGASELQMLRETRAPHVTRPLSRASRIALSGHLAGRGWGVAAAVWVMAIVLCGFMMAGCAQSIPVHDI